jgi:hypothetical protein
MAFRSHRRLRPHRTPPWIRTRLRGLDEHQEDRRALRISNGLCGARTPPTLTRRNPANCPSRSSVLTLATLSWSRLLVSSRRHPPARVHPLQSGPEHHRRADRRLDRRTARHLPLYTPSGSYRCAPGLAHGISAGQEYAAADGHALTSFGPAVLRHGRCVLLGEE